MDMNIYTQNLPVCNSGQHTYVMGLFNFFFVLQDLIDRIDSYFQRIAFQRNLLRLIGSFRVKSTNPSHLTHMDFADILSSQCTHQEMKILKMLSSYHERFQNYGRLNYGPSSLDNKPLRFLFSQF